MNEKSFWDPSNEPSSRAALASALQVLREKGLVPDLTGDAEIDKMLDECIRTLSTKGAEYTGGSPDRLNNFRMVGTDVDVPMEKVWYTYFNKHLRALQSYIKNGCTVKSNEPIQGRIMDLIVYLLLFNKMTLEIERKRTPAENPIDSIVQLAVETYNGRKP